MKELHDNECKIFADYKFSNPNTYAAESDSFQPFDYSII